MLKLQFKTALQHIQTVKGLKNTLEAKQVLYCIGASERPSLNSVNWTRVIASKANAHNGVHIS